MKKSKVWNLLFVSIIVTSICLSQTPTDFDFFLKEGIKCYNQGQIDDALVEFENVLLLDKNNFEAKIWIAQIYIDKKDIENAKKLIDEAAVAAPDHPKIKQLQELLGSSGESKPMKHDPVVYEIIADIASGTKLRPYGLVIPENKIAVSNPNIAIRALDREIDKVNEKEKANLDSDSYFKNGKGPLADVFNALKTNGLTSALDLYFAKFNKDPSIAAEDDQGLIERGVETFASLYRHSPENPENRYYFGALNFINGYYEEAERILLPLKKKPGIYAQRLIPIMTKLEKWRNEENERIRIAKKAEQEKRELELLAKKQQENKRRDVYSELKKKRENEAMGSVASKAKDEKTEQANAAASEEKALAEALHTQGYDLYKKGKLDEAIAKYNESLKKNDKSTDCLYHLGLAWTDKGLAGDVAAFDKAISYFESTIKLEPNGKNAADARSMISDINLAKSSMGE